MDLNFSVAVLKGVGKKRLEQYEKLNISSLKDLLFHFPKSYIDCSKFKPLKDLEAGSNCFVKAKVLEKKPLKKIKSLKILKAKAEDFLGEVFELVVFNNVYMFSRLKIGEYYIFFGRFERNYGLNQLAVSKVFGLNEAGLVPVYGLTAGLSSRIIAADVRKIFLLNCFFEESLPSYLIKKHDLIDLKDALENIHFPRSEVLLEKARKRLIFEELLIWQLGVLNMKNKSRILTSSVLEQTDYSEFLNSLSFSLTNSQKKVLDECVLDCSNNISMNRLIQGDVGCGKTIVAATLAYLFCKNNMQVALMAPTEVLARQHYASFIELFKPFKINVDLLVGSTSAKNRALVLNRLKEGDINILVGTHSLFQEKVVFSNLGLTITDEQHRFGVLQRRKLEFKGKNPHNLVMSATPIPRTLALIFYGDLNISTIEELPSGRVPIKTCAIPPSKRKRALKFVEKEVAKGRQAYIVCPLIEDGERESACVLKYVEELKSELKNISVFGLHGKMTPKDKEKVMDMFFRGDIDVLVSTTVVEVGVNVKNANIIIIENAELFGLSQLHQLRGRVGRGNFESYCVLISNFATKESRERIKIMCETNDGFEISRKDLILRGPGDFFGEKQHGFLKFKIANLFEDFEIFKCCKIQAEEILKLDENLENKENLKLKEAANEKFLCDEVVL